MAMAELHERAAAQTDHEDVARCAIEQQKRHHLLGVRGDQRSGILESHRALDCLQIEVQVSHSGTVKHEGAGYLSPTQLLHELCAGAFVRLKYTHRSWRKREGTRE